MKDKRYIAVVKINWTSSAKANNKKEFIEILKKNLAWDIDYIFKYRTDIKIVDITTEEEVLEND